jgi:hypothetical protein
LLKGIAMDTIQGPLYPRPVLPLRLAATNRTAPQRLKGKIVGVRPGRSGEVGTTQILTIKLSGPVQDAQRLLHADIEIVLPAK